MHRQPLHSSWPRCVHLHGVKRVATTFPFFSLFFFFFFSFFRLEHRPVWYVFSTLFSSSFFCCFPPLTVIPSLEPLARQTKIRRDSSNVINFSFELEKLDRIDFYRIEDFPLLTNSNSISLNKVFFFFLYFKKFLEINEIINKITRIVCNFSSISKKNIMYRFFLFTRDILYVYNIFFVFNECKFKK